MQVPISLLTYNIYIGHPFYILEGKHSLVQSIRLQSQIQHIKKLNPDIFCLQEMHSTHLLSYYRNNFPEYNCFYKKNPFAINQVILLFIILSIFFYITHLHLDSKYIFLLVIIFFANCYYLIFYTPAGIFLNGNIQTANVIFYKRRKFTFIKGHVHYFKNQDGDILNIIRQKGFLCLTLKHKGKDIQIVNCHLSNKQEFCERYQPCTADINRYEQIIQIIKTCFIPNSKIPTLLCGDFNSCNYTLEIQKLKEYMQNSLQNKPNHTWNKKNPLTSLFHIIEDHQGDYIFYKLMKCVMGKMVFDDIIPSLSDHYGVFSSFLLL